MAEADPAKPQVTDPDTVADLVRLLQIRGAVGFLDVADVVVPTVSLGSVDQPSVQVLQPAFSSVDVFSAGVIIAAAANTVHADTGQLPAGTYDVQVTMEPTSVLIGPLTLAFQHRDAANAATLMTFEHLVGSAVDTPQMMEKSFGYELALDERLRIVNPSNFGGTIRSLAIIFARLRT